MSTETEVIKKFIENRYKRLENGERRPSWEYISVQEMKEMVRSSDCEEHSENTEEPDEQECEPNEGDKIPVLDLPKLE